MSTRYTNLDMTTTRASIHPGRSFIGDDFVDPNMHPDAALNRRPSTAVALVLESSNGETVIISGTPSQLREMLITAHNELLAADPNADPVSRYDYRALSTLNH